MSTPRSFERTPLRVLLVEDAEDDALLVLRELRRRGFDPTFERVDTRDALRTALGAKWDIVISDFSLPSFDALGALNVLKEFECDLPFIVVSGTIDEETAVTALRAGAHDFILKSNLARLVPAIERELREAQVRFEQRKLQEQLIVADRMASVGMLAAGVAHEINNPLAAVLANLHFVRDEIEVRKKEFAPSIDFMESLTDACDGAERVRQIIRDVKVFSRGAEERQSAVDVHRVLDSTVRMAWNDIRHRAKIVRQYQTVKCVRGTEARLGQVFLNLIVNAAQAIEQGHIDKNEIRLSTWLEGSSVVVEIADTGPGIPAELLDRLFTPFFSTKPAGVGTGLGLSICRRIVTGLGGDIVASSEPGRGTSFRVTLPASDERPAQRESSPNLPAFLIERQGRILIVDDEVMITSALRRMLAPPHDVSVAFSANHALERIGSGERFDVILCDLLMPDMTGMDFYRALEERAAHQVARVIFMSGETSAPEVARFLEELARPYLEKPFDRALLISAVTELIGTSQS